MCATTAQSTCSGVELALFEQRGGQVEYPPDGTRPILHSPGRWIALLCDQSGVDGTRTRWRKTAESTDNSSISDVRLPDALSRTGAKRSDSRLSRTVRALSSSAWPKSRRPSRASPERSEPWRTRSSRCSWRSTPRCVQSYARRGRAQPVMLWSWTAITGEPPAFRPFARLLGDGEQGADSGSRFSGESAPSAPPGFRNWLP